MFIIKIYLLSILFITPQMEEMPDSLAEQNQAQIESYELLNERVDSLEKVLNEHDYRESFFDSIITSITNTYSTLLVIFVTIIIGVSGFLNWRSIKNYEEDLTKIKQDFNSLKDDLFEIQYKSIRDISTLYLTLQYREESLFYKSYHIAHDIFQNLKLLDLTKRFDRDDKETIKPVCEIIKGKSQDLIETLQEMDEDDKDILRESDTFVTLSTSLIKSGETELEEVGHNIMTEVNNEPEAEIE